MEFLSDNQFDVFAVLGNTEVVKQKFYFPNLWK